LPTVALATTIRPTFALRAMVGNLREIMSEGWRKRLGVEPSLPAVAGSDRF